MPEPKMSDKKYYYYHKKAKKQMFNNKLYVEDYRKYKQEKLQDKLLTAIDEHGESDSKGYPEMEVEPDDDLGYSETDLDSNW